MAEKVDFMNRDAAGNAGDEGYIFFVLGGGEM